jgi:hypothetical protein
MTPEALLHILNGGGSHYHSNIPADARVVSIEQIFTAQPEDGTLRRTIHVILESKTFKPLLEGQAIPRFTVQTQRKKKPTGSKTIRP